MKKQRNLTPIYLKAMKRIENGKEPYSCVAIDPKVAIRLPDNQGCARYNFAARLYAKIFSPNGRCFTFDNEPREANFHFVVNSDPDPTALRLTMLALAAACWRDFV